MSGAMEKVFWALVTLALDWLVAVVSAYLNGGGS